MTEDDRGGADKIASAQPDGRVFWCTVALVSLLLAPVSAVIAFVFSLGIAINEESDHAAGLVVAWFTAPAGWLVFVVISIVGGVRERRLGRAGWSSLGLGAGVYGVVALILLYVMMTELG